jgi:hypothetical protein
MMDLIDAMFLESNLLNDIDGEILKEMIEFSLYSMEVDISQDIKRVIKTFCASNLSAAMVMLNIN